MVLYIATIVMSSQHLPCLFIWMTAVILQYHSGLAELTPVSFLRMKNMVHSVSQFAQICNGILLLEAF